MDSTAPNITLIAPTNATSATTTAYNFTFNVSDAGSAVSNCSLILDGTVINTLTTITESTTLGMYNSSLSVAAHNWSVNCTDALGTQGSGATWNLTVTAAAAATTSSSSGGGYPTFTVSDSQLVQGYDKVLYKNWGVSFKVGNESHSLNLDSKTSTNATITVSSTPQTKTLTVGEEWKVNVNEDNYYDLLIRLNGLTFTGANVTVQSINDSVSSGSVVGNESADSTSSEGDAGEGSSFWSVTLIVSGVIFVIVLLAFGVRFIMSKKKKS